MEITYRLLGASHLDNVLLLGFGKRKTRYVHHVSQVEDVIVLLRASHELANRVDHLTEGRGLGYQVDIKSRNCEWSRSITWALIPPVAWTQKVVYKRRLQKGVYVHRQGSIVFSSES